MTSNNYDFSVGEGRAHVEVRLLDRGGLVDDLFASSLKTILDFYVDMVEGPAEDTPVTDSKWQFTEMHRAMRRLEKGFWNQTIDFSRDDTIIEALKIVSRGILFIQAATLDAKLYGGREGQVNTFSFDEDNFVPNPHTMRIPREWNVVNPETLVVVPRDQFVDGKIEGASSPEDPEERLDRAKAELEAAQVALRNSQYAARNTR